MAARRREAAHGIPLVRADLTRSDAQAVRQQLATAPFQDEAVLARWEAAWETLWHRAAVAFADPVGLILALKSVLGWRAGEQVGLDPLLDPAWREALATAWLYPAWRDVDPHSGQGRGAFVPDGAAGGPVRAGLCQHPFGLPGQPTGEGVPFWLEDISSVLSPRPGCGWGDVQVVYLSGNRLVAAGGSALLLTRDEAFGDALRRVRRPPGPLACALGLSQLRSLASRLARRQELAERYRQLRGRGWFQWPVAREEGRVWEMFLLTMASEVELSALQQFLQVSQIHAASPIWFRPANPLAGPGHFSGWQQFQARMLALPLYASLTDPEQKRIINRVQRWVGYREKKTPPGG
ncbi:MAG: DegT/DnrJ/EryC1/StrS aminotransferase family protein [Magnetococcales bacterium]|nr:DegT/DnrJ/EryC1/StrS aminotransferase family protein [Magnetococcales bacterium]